MEQIIYIITAVLNGGINLSPPATGMSEEMNVVLILGFIAVGISLYISIVNK